MEIIGREYFKQFETRNFWPPYISVLVPCLGRPVYLEKCLLSLHKYADVPIEIIVADDGSILSGQQRILEMRDLTSTIVLNPGPNVGLGRNMNRARSMATGDYLLTIEEDNYLTSSFLKRVKYALDKPYVGIVCVDRRGEGVRDGDAKHVHILPDGSEMYFKSPGSEMHGIRANVWDEVGGWNTNIQTTSSDVEFLSLIFAAGYFSVSIKGNYTNEQYKASEDGKTSTSEANESYLGSAGFAQGDNNTPSFFSKYEPFNKEKHHIQSGKRCEAVYHGVNDMILKDESSPAWTNNHFVCKERNSLFKDSKIDWEFAKKYGHDKWKDMIVKDFNL